MGSQLLAKASQAKVLKAKQKEIGFYTVTLSPEGKKDPLFDNLSEVFYTFQWHEDTFILPDKAVLLATSEACANQAFRIGKNAYGVHFHLEVDSSIIKSWIREYLDLEDKSQQEKIKQILHDGEKVGLNVLENGHNLCVNFDRVIDTSIKLVGNSKSYP